ncbi:MAG: ComF family protein [Balneolaceae bacterium]|nr:ComF family protein [Balneolaceae bacterium]
MISTLLKPYSELIFPSVCSSCGFSLTSGRKSVCSWCLNEKFETAGFDDDLILPESVNFLFSLWRFDRGGVLQDLLHRLKYDHQRTIGIELGQALGNSLYHNLNTPGLFPEGAEPLLVPVPVHSSRIRKRGYNQSDAIAEGISQSCGWRVCDKNLIVRTRDTKTQTGLNAEERLVNLNGAFKIDISYLNEHDFPLIVDDVFTTGATTFTIAGLIGENGRDTGILTIART